jgi:hypothetical protein
MIDGKKGKMTTYFYIEVTDTFGGDANYSWVTRHKVRAKSVRGAIVKLNRDCGLRFRKSQDFGDVVRYDSASGASCAFVESWDESHSNCVYSDTLA